MGNTAMCVCAVTVYDAAMCEQGVSLGPHDACGIWTLDWKR